MSEKSFEYVEPKREPKPRRCPENTCVHGNADKEVEELINYVMRNKERIRQLEQEIATIKLDIDQTNINLLGFIINNDLSGVVTINYRRLYDIVSR